MRKRQTIGPSSIAFALREKRNIMAAVILRDARTRFFNHGAGFLVVSVWPLVHMMVLIGINTAAGRQPPFGDSMMIFLATGLVPTMAFMYVSRFMSLSLILNRPMMSLPIVNFLDILTARAFLEIIAACITLFLFFVICWFVGNDPAPNDPVEAVYCYLATILLAVGVGSLVGVIVIFFDFFITIYVLFTIVIYISSGTLFVANQLPDAFAGPLSWNPVLVCVEWMRTAYFPTYSNRLVDKEYVVAFGAISLMLGLFCERFLRGVMLDK